MNRVTKGAAYKGGLSDMVYKPSLLTYSLLSYWFRGNTSIGKAMELIGVPCNKIDISLLVLEEGLLLTDPAAEQSTFYDDTLFKYDISKIGGNSASMNFSLKKIFQVSAVMNTMRIVGFQANVLKSNEALKETFLKLSEKVFSADADDSKRAPEELVAKIKDNVWPGLLAMGYILNFYSSYTQTLNIKDYARQMNEMFNRIKNLDWYYSSVEGLNALEEGKLNIKQFKDEYGCRADDDYEITVPRWRELSINELREKSRNMNRKGALPDPSVSLDKRIVLLGDIIVIRSNAKKKVLEHFYNLRMALIREFGEVPLETLVYNPKENVFENTVLSRKEKKQNLPKVDSYRKSSSGAGRGVSLGKITGSLFFIKETTKVIPHGAVAVFPGAGVTYSHLYPKCSGIIFLAGGNMSHGAIVSREYGIPAIIEPQLSAAPDGTKISIDGETGEWNLL